MYLVIIKLNNNLALYDFHFSWRATKKTIAKCEKDGIECEAHKFTWNKPSKSWRTLVFWVN